MQLSACRRGGGELSSAEIGATPPTPVLFLHTLVLVSDIPVPFM